MISQTDYGVYLSYLLRGPSMTLRIITKHDMIIPYMFVNKAH